MQNTDNPPHNSDAVVNSRDSAKNRWVSVYSYLRAMRIHQWAKNILIFIPLLTSHNWFNPELFVKCIAGFFAMSLCASAAYILNDIMDLRADRHHPVKCRRPFASGDISIVNGVFLSAVLLIIAISISFLLSTSFGLIVLVYFFITSAYSFYLKKIALLDTIILAGLYTMRVIAGALIINVRVSFWLLAFSVFIFYSLALLKRVAELNELSRSGENSAKGRGYSIKDIQILQQTGITSGLLSIVVFALYINSSAVLSLYSSPMILWFICPLILYWINRLWLKTSRNEMHDDPVVFALKDRCSMVLFVLAGILLVISTYFR